MTSSAACARINGAAAGTAPKQARRRCEHQRSGAAGKRCSASSCPPLPTSPWTPPLLLSLSRPSPSPSPSSSSSFATRAFFDGSRDNGEAATASDGDGGGSRALLAYSQAVTADDVEFFMRAAPAGVVGAMTETVSGLLGSLACSAIAASSRAGSGASASSSSGPFPASASAAIASSSSASLSSNSSSAAFDVRVRARDGDLGQLLYSTLMTGYLMRNAASRLRLRSRLSVGGSKEGTGGGVGAARALPAVLPPPSSSAAAAAAPLVPPPPPPPPSPSPSPSPSLLPSEGAPAVGDPTALPPGARAAALAALEGTPRLAPGSQTSRIEGDVLKWDQSHGLVSVPAADYIRALEAELAGARAAAAAAAAAVGEKEGEPEAVAALSALLPLPAPAASSPLSNPLLAFLRSADEASLTSLTAEASAGLLEAANAFVQRVMTGGESSRPSTSSRVFGAGGFGVVVGGGNGNGNGNSESVVREYRASELRHLLLFVMVVGFMLRTLEARLDIEFSMLLPPAEVEGGREDE